MISFILFVAFVISIIYAIRELMQYKSDSTSGNAELKKSIQAKRYFYRRKDYIMTEREGKFYRRLENVCRDKYYVFPQIHLSALLMNNTNGKYHKAARQKINSRSVDYVLVDRGSLKTAYAIELDDSSHDVAKRRTRDAEVEQMLSTNGVILVRFRNISNISDQEIIDRFVGAKHGSAVDSQL